MAVRLPEGLADRRPIVRGATHGGAYHGGAYYGTANVNRNVTASGNWNAYYGPHYGGAAAGAAAGLAVGTVVGALPAAAAAQSVAGQTYYNAGNTYYQPCYQGTDVNYCVVPNPNQ